MKNLQKITKTELIDLYFKKKMSLDQIGKYFGYADRQPIIRLFREFDIKTRSKTESARILHPIPDKQSVLSMLKGMSILACSKKNKISRATLTSWMKHHNIPIEYFVNKEIKNDIMSEKYTNSSPKEIAMAIGTTIEIVKYYKKSFICISYDKRSLFDKLNFYGYDLTNQGVAKSLRQDDENLYNSINTLTKNHMLQSEKITERLYRLFNNYNADQIDRCKYCNNVLKFYTYAIGYGNSSIGMCGNCLQKHNGFGVSLVSQKLFDEIYSKITLSSSDVCFYHSINKEFQLFVENRDIVALSEYAEHLNKSRYSLDFVLNNKVIEFDGTYYHNDVLKEQAKDTFLKYKGYEVLHVKEKDYNDDPKQVVNTCIIFLKA